MKGDMKIQCGGNNYITNFAGRRLVETYVDIEIVSVSLCLTSVMGCRCHYKVI